MCSRNNYSRSLTLHGNDRLNNPGDLPPKITRRTRTLDSSNQGAALESCRYIRYNRFRKQDSWCHTIDTSFVVDDEDIHLFTINRETHIYISKDSHLNFKIQMSINTSSHSPDLQPFPSYLYNSTTKPHIRSDSNKQHSA